MIRCSILLTVLIIGRIVLGQPEIKGNVIAVEEGDLLRITTKEKDTITVRLSNVDAPEPGQEFFDEARQFAEKLCLNKTVTFISKGKNDADELTGFVVLKNNLTLNNALIDAGLAWYFQRGLQMTIETQTLAKKEEEAKLSAKGLWKLKDPVAPWIFKRNQSRYEANSR